MPARRTILAAAAIVLCGSLPAAAKDGEQVVFVSWNLRNYLLSPKTDRTGRSTTPPKPEASADAIADTLALLKPDIVGVSEMGSARDLADLQLRLKARGLNLPYRTRVDATDQERHLALLSRYPLQNIRHDTRVGFTLGGLPQYVRRGFLDCEVKVRSDFSLRILGAHFKSRRIVPQFDQAEFRRNESLLLRSKITNILRAAPQTPLLLFGDLNDTKNSPSVAGLAGARGAPDSLTILPLADRIGDQWTYLWRETDEYSRVDFIMASKALLPMIRGKASRVHRAKNWTLATDHRPLVATITVPALPDTP